MKFFPLTSGRRSLDSPWFESYRLPPGGFRGFLLVMAIGVVLAGVVLFFVFRAM